MRLLGSLTRIRVAKYFCPKASHGTSTHILLAKGVTRSYQTLREHRNTMPFPPLCPNLVCPEKVEPEALANNPNIFHNMEIK